MKANNNRYLEPYFQFICFLWGTFLPSSFISALMLISSVGINSTLTWAPEWIVLLDKFQIEGSFSFQKLFLWAPFWLMASWPNHLPKLEIGGIFPNFWVYQDYLRSLSHSLLILPHPYFIFYISCCLFPAWTLFSLTNFSLLPGQFACF